MTTPARYFMLFGWARFLDMRRCDDIMKRIESRRTGGNWGIGVSDDYFALQWQRYEFRKRRASRAVGHDKMRSFQFTGKGPLALKLLGTEIPGWETDPEEKAKQADYDRFQAVRLRAKRACELLRTMPEPYDVREELSRLDWEESCRDAMGYY